MCIGYYEILETNSSIFGCGSAVRWYLLYVDAARSQQFLWATSGITRGTA